MDLKTIGWNDFYNDSFKEFSLKGYSPARVFAEHKGIYTIYTEIGEMLGEISGKFHYNVLEQQDYPAVGDWVVVTIRPEENKATIHHVLPRKSKFSRKAAGPVPQEQILASNMDTVFLINSLNSDFNMRRLERYLVLALESGADPVVILSKADLCNDAEEKLAQVQSAAPGVPVHVISSMLGEGIGALEGYLITGKTVALLGSSGVGKSTLINFLLDEQAMEVNDLSLYKDKGKHTSTHRELFILPQGGLIMDTPGMREIQMWDGSEGLTEAFDDIEYLAKQCGFSDCTHRKEPGCSVQAALRLGTLSEVRFDSYKKLQKEIVFIEAKQNKVNKSMKKKNFKNKSHKTRNKNIVLWD